MARPLEQPCYCDIRLCGKLKKNPVCKYIHNKTIPYEFK